MTIPAILAGTPLGRSGLRVGPMGWGTWRLADSAPSLSAVTQRILTAVDAGCTLIDTADVYGYGGAGFGAAEELLGRAFGTVDGLRQRVVLATKAGVDASTPYRSSRDYLVRACEASLRRLRSDCVELFQVHRPDLLTHPAEVAAALDRLLTDGKIRAAGVSNYTPAQTRALMAHLPFALAAVQPELSVMAPGAIDDGTLDLAMEHGLAVLAWSPLAQGRLMQNQPDARSRVIPVLDAVAQQLATTREAVCYAWVMQLPAGPIPLIGSQQPQRIRDATAAVGLKLPAADWYRILVACRGRPMP